PRARDHALRPGRAGSSRRAAGGRWPRGAVPATAQGCATDRAAVHRATRAAAGARATARAAPARAARSALAPRFRSERHYRVGTFHIRHATGSIVIRLCALVDLDDHIAV